MIKIPFSFLPVPVLKKLAEKIEPISITLARSLPNLKLNLQDAEIRIKDREYVGMCFIASLFLFIFCSVIFTMIMYKLNVHNFYFYGLLVGLIFGLFAFFQQMMYPKLIVSRRVRGIEKNLIEALQNLLVQINSGVTLFDAIANIASSDYGEISIEFEKAIKKITAGLEEEEALEQLATKNPSKFFRRAMWQLVNGMRAGGDVNIVIREVINSLSEEQLISIQRYGSQLNPLAMFYMLVAVIMPSLGITFIIILSSFVNLSESMSQMTFFGLLILVVLFQIVFLGLIGARRPSLMVD